MAQLIVYSVSDWYANVYIVLPFVASTIPPDITLEYNIIPFHAIPAIIAVNMILATATGGIVAVAIATWAQVC